MIMNVKLTFIIKHAMNQGSTMLKKSKRKKR